MAMLFEGTSSSSFPVSLRRGQACLTCRYFSISTSTVQSLTFYSTDAVKWCVQPVVNLPSVLTLVQKCDAMRPACGSCVKEGIQGSCEYQPMGNETVELGRKVRELRVRLRGLEKARIASEGTESSDSASPSESVTYIVNVPCIYQSTRYLGEKIWTWG